MSPSIEFYENLEKAFDFYNDKLFNNELNKVFLSVRSAEVKNKKTRNLGYYSKDIFAHSGSPISEIALNINTFADRSEVDILSTLVHEMTHQWRDEVSNEPNPKNEHHDKIWGRKMEQIGLIPSKTGLPEGKKTGKQMTHYIATNGLFAKYTKELLMSGFSIQIFDTFGAYVNKGFIIAPVNSELSQKWIDEAETPEEKERVEKALNIISEDPLIQQVDINDLTERPKTKKPTVKKTFKYICPSCKNKISGPVDLQVLCLECDVIYEENEK